MEQHSTINPRSGTAFILRQGQRLKIIDPQGEQVSDLICYNLDDRKEFLSPGRTIDYSGTILLTTGHDFYSNRSNVLFTMVEDTCGRHDILFAPCSAEMFRKTYGHEHPHRGCFGNLCEALADYGITPDEIDATFNVFMHAGMHAETGEVTVLPPKSKAGDYVVIEARMDLLVGLTACSAEKSNNYAFKPIDYVIL